MSEFKPTLAVLFSELLTNPKTGLEYQWWGYADLDLIWGKINHFKSLFHDQLSRTVHAKLITTLVLLP
jgi:hypothetical protein